MSQMATRGASRVASRGSTRGRRGRRPGVRSNQEYMVERILAVRRNREGNSWDYLLKWENYDDDHCTWEPVENLNCPRLIAEFEASRATTSQPIASTSQPMASTSQPMSSSLQPVASTSQPVASTSQPVASTPQFVPKRAIGFDRGLEPEKILSVTDTPGELFFVMKWKGLTELDIVPAAEANIRCPQVVIRFYEQHIVPRFS